MPDPTTQRLELDEWRDLVSSAGWARLLTAFDQQWGDGSVVRTLETLTAQPTGAVADEAKRLLQVRVALRQFLAVPAARIADLERQRQQAEIGQTKPWTRPA